MCPSDILRARTDDVDVVMQTDFKNIDEKSNEGLATLVVVGRANTGKSTLVATLTEDDSIRISDIAGTTTEARRWVVRANNKPILAVIDTPGFEDAVGALGIMRSFSKDASDRPDAVRAFIAQAEKDGTFSAERKLLNPVLDGGAILYVADAAYPYRKNFEAELEILSWTGQPRAGLINATEAATQDPGLLKEQRAQWRNALTQYCSIVREISARDATWDERVNLLRDISSLRDEWRGTMQRVADQLESLWKGRREKAAYELAKMLTTALTHTRRELVVDPDDLSAEKERLEKYFADDLRKVERKGQREVERIYGFKKLSRANQADIEAPRINEDLFGKRVWKDLGLSTAQLVGTGALVGAAAGGGIDAIAGGLSLGAFLVAGGAIGAAGTALMLRDRLVKATVDEVRDVVTGGELRRADKHQKRKRAITVGPHKNPNFPWILLSRGLGHWYAVERRTHSQEGALMVHPPAIPATQLPKDVQRSLQRLFKDPDATMTADLEEALYSLYTTPSIQQALERACERMESGDVADSGGA